GVEGDDQVTVREFEDDLGLVEKAIGFALVGLLGQDLLDDAELFETVDVAADRDVDLAHPPARERLEQDVFPESLWISIEHQPGAEKMSARQAKRRLVEI